MRLDVLLKRKGRRMRLLSLLLDRITNRIRDRHQRRVLEKSRAELRRIIESPLDREARSHRKSLSGRRKGANHKIKNTRQPTSAKDKRVRRAVMRRHRLRDVLTFGVSAMYRWRRLFNAMARGAKRESARNRLYRR